VQAPSVILLEAPKALECGGWTPLWMKAMACARKQSGVEPPHSKAFGTGMHLWPNTKAGARWDPLEAQSGYYELA
jgi:hypothetical protein